MLGSLCWRIGVGDGDGDDNGDAIVLRATAKAGTMPGGGDDDLEDGNELAFLLAVLLCNPLAKH